jgi:tetratricopeptide (TPR) repeat protein
MSSASAELELMRATMLLDTDPAAAARHASAILASDPAHEQAGLLFAAASRRLGDAASAVGALAKLAEAQPSSAVIQLELGRSYAAAGRADDASRAFGRAVELDPALADAWGELAARRFSAGDIQGGDAAYFNYSRLRPESPALNDARIALTAYRLRAAEAMLHKRLQDLPDDAPTLRLLADAANRRGDLALAEQRLRASLAAAPGYAAARYDLALLLYGQQRVDEALALLERLLATEPGNADYLSRKAQCLRLVGRNDEAIAMLRELIAAHPDSPDLWLTYGNLEREVGEQARAVEAYRRALSIRAGFGEAYWSLANLKTVRLSDDDVNAMQQQLARSPALSANRIPLEFALGKALEDRAQYAAAFEHYQRGNVLQRATIDYDAAVISADVARSKAMYNAGFFNARAGWGLQHRDPIFIVGLPRSGSTLLEQILASHSMIEGTRELPDMPAVVRELAGEGPPATLCYPEPVGRLSRAEIEAAAQRYLSRTEAHRPLGRPRFVDKMLSNFGHIGLIHLMFPRATIIDARRHPLACTFSCYKQLFGRGVKFSYDLAELASYARDYFDLMQHMDAVLPGRVHRLRYDDLIADPEGEVRRLLDHCGLPFEPACLKFYDNPRVVQTVSSEQVRQPLYTDALDHWRHFEPWLGPLKEVLVPALRDYASQR